jgi:trk system potassium uptake protein
LTLCDEGTRCQFFAPQPETWCDLVMNIVIIGCGRVGSGLANTMSNEGHNVVILDKSSRSFRRLNDDFKGRTIIGSGFDRDALEDAGARNADALAAVTSGDNSNILCARIARENFRIPNVVARIYDPRRAEIYQRLGIPTVATVTWTIDQVRRWLLPSMSTVSWTDASGELHLIEQPLPPNWAGKKLVDLNDPGRIKVIAVNRAGVIRLDPEELVGQERDLLQIAVVAGSEAELAERLEGSGS